jgi:hypothetical protein
LEKIESAGGFYGGQQKMTGKVRDFALAGKNPFRYLHFVDMINQFT